MREPLILPLVAFAAGILADQTAPFSAREAALAAAAIAILAVLPCSPWLKRTAVLLAMFFAGAFVGAWHRPGPPPEIDATSREIVIVAGCVVEPTVFAEDRAQFTLEIEPGARAHVAMSFEDGDPRPPRLSYGQRVEIEARLRPPHNFRNPGSFDYAAYLARRNIFWTATIPRNTPPTVLPGRCGSRFMAGIFALRTAALDRIEHIYFNNGYAEGMMDAILIGETDRLERVWTDDFRRTGTFHALVISGVHVTVLAAVLLFLLRWLPLSELSALAATGAAAWLYALVSGFSAPVVRAAGGFTLYTLARACFRRARVMNLLAAVALVYLAWDPAQIFEASFQLSFLSVAAIGALAAPLLESTTAPYARGLRGIANADLDPHVVTHVSPRVAQFRVEVRLAAETLWLWTGLPLRWAQEALAAVLRCVLFAFEMAVVSATIQIGLALPMAEYFHRVSFTGLSANLLIVPAMNAVVPLGFIAIFTGWRWTGSLAGGLLRFSARVAAWHANLEPAWRVPDPPLWLVLAFAAALIVCAILMVRRAWRWPAIAGVLGLFALLLWQPWLDSPPTGLLELTAIDVGQGDSLLVVLPRGEIMLIDGGGRLVYGRQRKSNLDIGEDVVSPYLWSRGIRRIDVMVATHSHQDHIGGLGAVMSDFHPGELWTGANPPAELLEIARHLRIPASQKHPAGPIERSGATLEILAPSDDYLADKPGNNDSLVLRISYGSRSFLLTGDMERGIESKLLASGADLHADVLKVGHHGSRTSSTEPFLEAVSPSVALISAGFENSFGHPHPDVLGRLSARHTAILRTDLDGLVSAQTDGRGLWFTLDAWQEKPQLLRFPVHLLQ
ncbi:MAG TPA: ComEC/Rec2 family competence protein [Bryobacteraceae bacterium]|nr:ComEC/Rec2 family competence protein [Bryobacteraceae bacterium]